MFKVVTLSAGCVAESASEPCAVLANGPVQFVSVPDEGVPRAPPEYRIVAAESGKV
jgi:hypothetical protein